MAKKLSAGLVHDMPDDLLDALIETNEITSLWESLTPIGRNEFICWVEDAKQDKTREKRIRRTVEELAEGQKTSLLLGRLHSSNRQEARQLAASRSD